jgi:hypothetical protein
MCLDGPLRFRPGCCWLCGFPGRAGRPGYRVDVTFYLFLPVRCVIDQVRLTGQIGRSGIKRAPTREVPYAHLTETLTQLPEITT